MIRLPHLPGRIVKRQASEIGTDPLVRAYAWAVLAAQFVAFLFFLDTRALIGITTRVEPLCWPYFESCWRYRLTTDNQLVLLTLTQLALLVVAATALAARHFRTYWCTLIALNLLLFAIMSLDYRLRANEFYMLFWLNFVFLFWPEKRWSLPLVIVSFYFWAGTLKLNHEWLSGSVLYHDLFLIPPRFAWLACAYVVVLEMAMTWGLLARRAWLRWAALGQLALFHIESLSQIHWFYPALMAAILAWFVIAWTRGTAPPLLSAFLRGRAPRAAYSILALFAAFQLVPYLYPGDRALTGQARIFALHMFEARQQCEVTAVLHRTDGTAESRDIEMHGLAPREICDPVVYYSRVESLCRSRNNDPTLQDVDFTMNIKRTTDPAMTTIIDETSFCGKGYTYSPIFNNRWIR